MTYVEIDRCVTDAVAVVANCRLGKRALKFRDWGKVAATFVDLKTGRAIRVAAKESSKQAAREMFPELAKEAGQQKADRKSTRLNSSHSQISYAVFCLKKKKSIHNIYKAKTVTSYCICVNNYDYHLRERRLHSALYTSYLLTWLTRFKMHDMKYTLTIV